MESNDMIGKVVVVTGARQGIGKAIVEKFERAGSVVIGIDLIEIPEKNIFKCDVSNESDVMKFFSRLEMLDVLVNNAGITHAGYIENYNPADFRRLWEVNLFGAFLCMKYSVPIMRKANESSENNFLKSIVNISSVSGLKGFTGEGAYCSTKWGLEGLMKVAAKEFANYGIRVNNVNPCPTDTPHWEQLLAEYAKLQNTTKEEITKYNLGKVLIKRLCKPEEVANAVFFLASDKAKYITGTSLKVDGGQTTK